MPQAASSSVFGASSRKTSSAAPFRRSQKSLHARRRTSSSCIADTPCPLRGIVEAEARPVVGVLLADHVLGEPEVVRGVPALARALLLVARLEPVAHPLLRLP